MNIKEAANTAASVTGGRTIIPVLSMLAIKAENGVIQFTGSDLEVSIRTTAEYSTTPFACCVNARHLCDAINATESPEFTMTDAYLLIKKGRMRFKLPHLHFDMHPGLIEAGSDGVEIPSSVAELMEQVRYAAGKDDVRASLNGICITAQNGTLSVVATNGHRLAMRTQEADGDCKIIIPNKGVAQIIKHRPDNLLIGRVIVATKYGFEMICNSITLAYPDFTKALASDDQTLTFNRDEMRQTLSAFKTIRNANKFVRTDLSWNDGTLKIVAQDDDYTAIENQIPATFTTPGNTAVNLPYLADMIDACHGENITLSFNAPPSPMLCRRENAIELIMPMK